jgi:hypothetical protein
MTEDNNVIDWTDPAADVRDQLIERWFRRHPGINYEDNLVTAEEYADDMIHRHLR